MKSFAIGAVFTDSYLRKIKKYIIFKKCSHIFFLSLLHHITITHTHERNHLTKLFVLKLGGRGEMQSDFHDWQLILFSTILNCEETAAWPSPPPENNYFPVSKSYDRKWRLTAFPFLQRFIFFMNKAVVKEIPVR